MFFVFLLAGNNRFMLGLMHFKTQLYSTTQTMVGEGFPSQYEILSTPWVLLTSNIWSLPMASSVLSRE